MSIFLRVFLVIISTMSVIYVLHKIRKAMLKIEYSLFWIIFSTIIVFLNIFPNIAIKFATMMGVMSAVNFIFLIMIIILFIHGFSMTMKVSSLETKINNLTEEIAISNIENRDKTIGKGQVD